MGITTVHQGYVKHRTTNQSPQLVDVNLVDVNLVDFNLVDFNLVDVNLVDVNLTRPPSKGEFERSRETFARIAAAFPTVLLRNNAFICRQIWRNNDNGWGEKQRTIRGRSEKYAKSWPAYFNKWYWNVVFEKPNLFMTIL